jgi:diguanylate cyclase (GGDEF)-like protein
VEGLHRAHITRSEQEQERLAKEWLLRLIERTPLPDVGTLPLSWIIDEAPPLIADILGTLGQPGSPEGDELESRRQERTARLSRLREGADAAEQIPRDLAVLQGLLIESLRRELPDRSAGEFACAVERLAEVFGGIQGVVSRSLAEGRGSAAAGTGPVEPAIADELTGLPGPEQLDEWLRILLAERKRYGHEFALALIDIDGLERINKAYGRSAGDRIVAAVAGVVGGQVRTTDHTFRLQDDEFAIIAPHTEVAGLVPMAERIAGLIERSQIPDGPRIAVVAGVVGAAADGETPEQLLEAAVAATYAAKAAAKPVATTPARPPLRLQDP